MRRVFEQACKQKPGDEKMASKIWYVYELIDPRDERPFYVGCTTKPRERLAAHGSDSASSAWRRMQEIKANGDKATLKVLASFDTKIDALRYEHAMIIRTPALENAGFSLRCPRGCDCLKHNPTPFLNNEGWTAEFTSKRDALRASRFIAESQRSNA